MELAFLENVHRQPCVTCQMSRVKCTFFSDKIMELFGGGHLMIWAYPVWFLCMLQETVPCKVKMVRVSEKDYPREGGAWSW